MSAPAHNAVTGSWVGLPTYTGPAGDAVTGRWEYVPETIDDTEILALSGPTGTTLAFAQTVSEAGPFATLNGFRSADSVLPGNAWLGYSFDGANLIIPIAALPGVSAQEANAAIGDSRAIMLGVMMSASRFYGSLAPLARPLAMSIYENWTYDFQYSPLSPCDRVRFSVDFNVHDDANNVVAEA